MSGRLRRRYVDVPWGQVHVAETVGAPGAPGDRPTVVLLHQTPRSIDELGAVADALADTYRVVCIDTPGMGASDPHPGGAAIEHYAEGVVRVLDGLGAPVHLVGHHTGGVIGIEVAASRPDLVRTLVLSSTPWVDEGARRRRAGHEPIDAVAVRPDGAHLGELWRQRARYYPPDRPDLLHRFVADALRCADPADGHRAVGRYEMERRAPLVSCPVCVVGHEDDPFSMASHEAVARHLRAARCAVVAGGAIPLEHRARPFAEIVRTFVADGEADLTPS